MDNKVIWLTGLSGAGKSTIAQGLAAALLNMGHHAYVLDGDILRSGLNQDLGFSQADRVENIRRTAQVAKLMTEAGMMVIVALISPYTDDRQKARSLFKEGQFIEVFINTPIELCIQRDPKGFYAKALKGEIKNFTGIDAPYEAPTNPEIILETQETPVDDLIKIILKSLNRGKN